MLAAIPRGGETWKFLDGIAELMEKGRQTLAYQLSILLVPKHGVPGPALFSKIDSAPPIILRTINCKFYLESE